MNDQENLEDKIEQIHEALSDDNRHFFRVNHDWKEGSDDELMMWYIDNGGAKGHAERRAEREKQEKESL
ncbi:MAG: hypothetical protein WCV55_03680 [Candidatus Paceibacterota bacterium]